MWKTRYLIGYDPFLDTNSVYRLDNLKEPEVVLSSKNMTESSDVFPKSSLKNSKVSAPQLTAVVLVIRLSIFQIWSI